MKKIYIKQLLTAILLLCSTVVSAETYSGTCGTNVNWSLDTETGVLEITGTGAMDEHPWSAYRYDIKYVSIGNGVTNIADDAFYYCESLTSITIPNSVTSIGKNAFYVCIGLTSIEIPNSVTAIGTNAFHNCTRLTSITIPNSVTTIENLAFSSCTSLTSITIPNSVTAIGNQAFYYCTRLTNIEIPNSVTKIGAGAFVSTAWLENQPDGVVYAGKVLYAYKGTMPQSTSIIIKEGTLGIAMNAFYNCSGLTSVTIPNSVTTIGNYTFDGCSGLTSVTIPNSVTTIGVNAFSGCSSLTNITIPKSVTTIRANAFYSCTGITSITIPNSVTTIRESVFEGCTGLTSITIPNSVTTIESKAFYGCTNLAEIYSLAETPATIYSYTFSDYSATLYVPAGAKAAYQAADYWKNFTNIVEMTPTEETPTEVTITIGQYGTATYCSPYALDFSEVEGLKAYTATGYNSSTGVVTLTRAQTAEDATGLFLMGEPGEYTVPVIEYSSDYMLNMLVGTLETTAVNNKTDDGNYINFKYTIGSESSQPMFYQFEDGSTLSAGKAYLQLPARLFTTTASKSISLRFDDGRLTDIDRVESESNDTQTIIYDLCGRRVSKPAKGGIYIKNGKKIIL